MSSRLVIASLFILLCSSCHKEYSCEGNCPPGGASPAPPPGGAQAPTIASLNCAGGSFSAAAVEATLYSGQYTITYTGGNAAAYKADTMASIGVTGLTAVLAAGT